MFFRLTPTLFALGIGFYSLQAGATETLYEATDVNILWVGDGPLSGEPLTRARRRGTELADFYRSGVLAKVPHGLWPAGGPPPLTVRFRNDIPTDGGLFTPPSPGARLMIEIHTSLLQSGDAERLLAHEFFHALHWTIHPDEPAWLREGLAQLFETRVYARGKFNANNLAAGFAEISTPLTGELHVDAISAAQYGHVLLYFWYLYSRCGGEDLFWDLVKSKAEVFGIDTIDQALRKSSRAKAGCRDFMDSFVEFQLARVINSRAIEGDDPERWFLVASTLAQTKPEKNLPTAARWARTKPATPIFIEMDVDRVNGKTLPSSRVFWIESGSRPKVTEGLRRPSAKANRILILRMPAR